MMTTSKQLQAKAKDLGLYGLLRDWDDVEKEPWLESLIQREESVRAERSLERRIQRSRIGTFSPIADYDFAFPKSIDREQIEDLFTFDWLDSAVNVILVGPNGVGKTMLAQNLAHQAVDSPGPQDRQAQP